MSNIHKQLMPYLESMQSGILKRKDVIKKTIQLVKKNAKAKRK